MLLTACPVVIITHVKRHSLSAVTLHRLLSFLTERVTLPFTTDSVFSLLQGQVPEALC